MRQDSSRIAKMKDGAIHLAYQPEHAVDLDMGAVAAAELHLADEGHTTTLSNPWRRPRQTSRRWIRHRRRWTRPTASPTKSIIQGQSLTGFWTTVAGRPGSVSPGRTAFHAGAVTGRRGARSPTTACVSSPRPPARPSSCVLRLSSASLPTTSIAAACAELGGAGARTCTSGTCFTSPATISHC